MKIKTWKELLPFLQKHKVPVLWASFAVVGALTVWANAPSKAEPAPAEAPIELSTFIPKGHSLIPVELKGAEKLDGVLGAHGIVDLYESGDMPGQRPRLVGRRLRLMRAPLNPQAFAILVRSDEAERILSFQGPFVASVLPPQSAAHEVPEERRRQHGPVIEFQGKE